MTPATDAAREAIAREVLAGILDRDKYPTRAQWVRNGQTGDIPQEVVFAAMLAFADTEAASQPREGEVETATRAIFEADPDVGMTWDAFVALAEKEPDFQQVVDGQRRAGKAAVEAIGKMRWQTADTAVADVLAQPDAQIEAEATAEDRAWAAGFKTGSLTQRPPEQAGAVPGGIVVTIDHGTANSHFFDDRLVVEGECIAFTDEPWTARIAAALSAAPTPPDAGPGEIPAGMVAWHGGDCAPDDWDGGAIWHQQFGCRWIGINHALWKGELYYKSIHHAVDCRTARGRVNLTALQAADQFVKNILAKSDAQLVADAMKAMSSEDVKVAVRAWLDADDATHWGAFETALDGAVNETPERALIVAMLRSDAATMRDNADAYSEEAPTDARALHEVATTLSFKAAQIERGDHLAAALTNAPPQTPPDAGIGSDGAGERV